MKKTGLILILILALSILPAQAAEPNFFTVETGFTTEHYKDSAGYDRLLNQDGSVLVHSQRWTVEYLDGPKWKRVGIPYQVTQDGDTITRHYKDYLGTEIEVIYHHTDEQTKIDIVIHSGETREYRIVWSLDGVTPGAVSYGDNYVGFNGEHEVTFSWQDAFDQYGDITTFEVTEQADGKKLDVIFNVGHINEGETLTLDPVISPGDAGYRLSGHKNRLFETDSGRIYAFWRDGVTRIQWTYTNDTIIWTVIMQFN